MGKLLATRLVDWSGAGGGYVDAFDCVNYGDIDAALTASGICDMGRNISNCRNYGKVSGSEYVGGICATVESTVENCVNKGDVKGAWQTGGIVGANPFEGNVEIKMCRNYGNIESTGNGSADIGRYRRGAYRKD